MQCHDLIEKEDISVVEEDSWENLQKAQKHISYSYLTTENVLVTQNVRADISDITAKDLEKKVLNQDLILYLEKNAISKYVVIQSYVNIGYARKFNILEVGEKKYKIRWLKYFQIQNKSIIRFVEERRNLKYQEAKETKLLSAPFIIGLLVIGILTCFVFRFQCLNEDLYIQSYDLDFDNFFY